MLLRGRMRASVCFPCLLGWLACCVSSAGGVSPGSPIYFSKPILVRWGTWVWKPLRVALDLFHFMLAVSCLPTAKFHLKLVQG